MKYTWEEQRAGLLADLAASLSREDALAEQLSAVTAERDARLSDAKHYFEWLGETQKKLDACKQELLSTTTGNSECIRVLEDRVTTVTAERDEYLARWKGSDKLGDGLAEQLAAVTKERNELKAYWFDDADPAETKYAEDYALAKLGVDKGEE